MIRCACLVVVKNDAKPVSDSSEIPQDIRNKYLSITQKGQKTQ